MGSGSDKQAVAHQTGRAQSSGQAGPDVEGEHDPKRSRDVSRAGLEREASKRTAGAAVPNAAAAHDQADQAAYDSLFSAIDLLAKRMHEAADNIFTIINAQEDEGGIYKKIDVVQTIHDRIADELASLQMTMMRVKTASFRPLGQDLAVLQGGLQAFSVAVDGARSKFGGSQSGLRLNLEGMRGEIQMMYTHAGLDMASSTPIEHDDRISGDTEQMENVAIGSGEASIHASVQAVRAKLSAPDAELKEEVGKLVGALEQTREQLEAMANPGRIRSTKKLAGLIHEAQGVITELDKKPAMRDYLASAAIHNTMMILRSHLKK